MFARNSVFERLAASASLRAVTSASRAARCWRDCTRSAAHSAPSARMVITVTEASRRPWPVSAAMSAGSAMPTMLTPPPRMAWRPGTGYAQAMRPAAATLACLVPALPSEPTRPASVDCGRPGPCSPRCTFSSNTRPSSPTTIRSMPGVSARSTAASMRSNRRRVVTAPMRRWVTGSITGALHATERPTESQRMRVNSQLVWNSSTGVESPECRHSLTTGRCEMSCESSRSMRCAGNGLPSTSMVLTASSRPSASTKATASTSWLRWISSLAIRSRSAASRRAMAEAMSGSCEMASVRW